jgi:excisionase family DNA binding protein
MAERSTNGHDELLTPEEVAQILKTKPKRVLEAGQRGDLPRVKWGKFVRFRRRDVDAFIEAHRQR